MYKAIKMPEVTIKYKNPKTLEALKDLSKYFDFSIAKPKTGKKNAHIKDTFTINGVTVVRGDSSIDISEMSDVFTGKNIDAKELRKGAWLRSK